MRYPPPMTTPPPTSALAPWTDFFLAGIRQEALADFIVRSGLQPDVLSGAIERAAETARAKGVAAEQQEGLRQAVAIAVEEARQLRLGSPKA